jgi:predicted dienelactone hydrolase
MSIAGPVQDDHVGCVGLSVRDREQGVSLPVSVLFPTDAPSTPRAFGQYIIDVASDAPVIGRQLPLVVISHGNGGSPWAHRGTALHLVRHGMVVALVEHLGNSRSDSTLSGSTEMLQHRPRHLRLALDAVLAAPDLCDSIDASRIAAIGHSIGAYTALASAGGRPMTQLHDRPSGPPRPLAVTTDERLRALVLLAPAAGWFAHAGALEKVRAPMLIMTGASDQVTPPLHAAIVMRGVPKTVHVTHHVVANAGHFAFQTPFPACMTTPDFAPSQDPPGFDRAAFHTRMNDAILTFLRERMPFSHTRSRATSAVNNQKVHA